MAPAVLLPRNRCANRLIFFDIRPVQVRFAASPSLVQLEVRLVILGEYRFEPQRSIHAVVERPNR